jgi:transcriptional regulator with XRE-family HTH domain
MLLTRSETEPIERYEKIGVGLPRALIYELFSERLRTVRALRKMSQRELGRKAGIPPSSIGFFEVGARKPNIESLRRLSGALNVASDYLLGLVDIPDDGATRETMYQDIDRLTGSDRELVKKLLRALADRHQSNPVSGKSKRIDQASSA